MEENGIAGFKQFEVMKVDIGSKVRRFLCAGVHRCCTVLFISDK